MTYRLNDKYQVKEVVNGSQIYIPIDQLSPERANPRCGIITLDEQAQWSLVQYLTDGLCPVCGTEIALHDIICDDCLSNALAVR